MLDVSASYDVARDSVSVILVNRSLSEDVDVQVSFGDRRAKPNLKTTVLTGVDPKAHNTWQRPDVNRPTPGRATADDEGRIHVLAPSLGLTVVCMQLEQRG